MEESCCTMGMWHRQWLEVRDSMLPIRIGAYIFPSITAKILLVSAPLPRTSCHWCYPFRCQQEWWNRRILHLDQTTKAEIPNGQWHYRWTHHPSNCLAEQSSQKVERGQSVMPRLIMQPDAPFFRTHDHIINVERAKPMSTRSLPTEDNKSKVSSSSYVILSITNFATLTCLLIEDLGSTVRRALRIVPRFQLGFSSEKLWP